MTTPIGNIVEQGRSVIAIERAALARVEERLDASFDMAVRMMLDSHGKVVVIGVGKSGIIARKLAATLNSTGTPAFYLHGSDALHGDLGMVRREDVAIVFSKSGGTEELALLLPSLRKIGVRIIAITANRGSLLGRSADAVIDCSVEREACPYDVAPTASTTAMLALADALAVVLYQHKGFTRDDFATTHPGGIIGRRLMLRLNDIMKRNGEMPVVDPEAGFSDVVIEMSRKRMGATLVVEEGRLRGIITDGDLRRLLERGADLSAMSAAAMMSPGPMTATSDLLGATALVMLEETKRMHLPVVDEGGTLLGIVHLHDLIEAGLKG